MSGVTPALDFEKQKTNYPLKDPNTLAVNQKQPKQFEPAPSPSSGDASSQAPSNQPQPKDTVPSKREYITAMEGLTKAITSLKESLEAQAERDRAEGQQSLNKETKKATKEEQIEKQRKRRKQVEDLSFEACSLLLTILYVIAGTMGPSIKNWSPKTYDLILSVVCILTMFGSWVGVWCGESRTAWAMLLAASVNGWLEAGNGLR